MPIYLALFLPALLFAFELSVQTGKEENQEYSVLHLKHSEPFLCQAETNPLHEVTSIICAFNQRPAHPFREIENSFFKVHAKVKDKTFFVMIEPKQKITLRAQHFDLISDNELFTVNDDFSSHWLVIGYEHEVPLIQNAEKQQSALNLPVVFPTQQPLPYVGGLDMHGHPIHMTRVKDVSDYLVIKQAYEDRDYEKVLSTIDSVLSEFPNTIFKSEMMLYRIRAYHDKGETEPVITLGKQFIREYSSDLNIAEVLADIADAYSKIAMYTDADYFFDRLFDEHPQSDFAHLGLIYKGDQLSSAGNAKKAIGFFERALYEAQSKKIAALAAYKLAQHNIEIGNATKASDYIVMILDGYAEQFMLDQAATVQMAEQFASAGEFQTAARLIGALLDRMERGDEGYERMLKDKGLWLAQTDQKEEALESFNRYLEKFGFGEYVDEIKRQKDALFFELTEMNTSERLKEYDQLIAKYQRDSIAERACYEKGKLLSELKMHDEILSMEESLLLLNSERFEDTQKMVDQAVDGLMHEALELKNCERVVSLSKRYDVNLSQEWDEGLFGCFVAAGDYETAKRLAQQHLTSDDPKERMAWLERYVDIDFALGNYTAVADALRELIALHVEKDMRAAGFYRKLFDASQRLGDHEGMLSSILEIEGIVGLVYSDIERFTQMMTHAKEQKNTVMVETFASKVVTLQKEAKSYTQSPYVEFTLSQALVEHEKFNEALELLKGLDERNMSAQQRSRQRYTMGTLYQKTGAQDAAKEAYTMSTKEDTQGVWAKLAADALKLME